MKQRGTKQVKRDDVLLSLRGISKNFDVVKALNNISLDIMWGEILGVAGPNGAGKTTLINVCTGFLSASSGSIFFDDVKIDGKRPHTLCHMGIARTFQIPKILTTLSVYENVATAVMFGLVAKDIIKDDKKYIEELLEITDLTRQRNRNADNADLLTRKKIMLAAAVATKPKLIFLDEPLAGLNDGEISIIMKLILFLHEQLNLSFIVVEHKIRALSKLSDRILIMNYGEVLCLDTPQNVLTNEHVIEIYIGSHNVA